MRESIPRNAMEKRVDAEDRVMSLGLTALAEERMAYPNLYPFPARMASIPPRTPDQYGSSYIPTHMNLEQ
jgi:hypothetical protein